MENESTTTYTSFLGTGWSFPPEFMPATGGARMTADEEDIHASLMILFGTSQGERFMRPKYGLNVRDLLFEPISTTITSIYKDRIKKSILIYEPRIEVAKLELDTSQQMEGRVVLILDYVVRSTNSRYNLVYPFTISDGNELRSVLGTLSEWELHG